MSRSITGFEISKQAASNLKRYYAKLGNEVVRELTIQFQSRFEIAYIRMLDDFYQDYSPRVYKRTYTLLYHSFETHRRAKGNYGRVTMSYTPDIMQDYYDEATYGGDGHKTIKVSPDAEWVLNSFESGWHGPESANIPYHYDGKKPLDYIYSVSQQIINTLCENPNTVRNITARASKRASH